MPSTHIRPPNTLYSAFNAFSSPTKSQMRTEKHLHIYDHSVSGSASVRTVSNRVGRRAVVSRGGDPCNGCWLDVSCIGNRQAGILSNYTNASSSLSVSCSPFLWRGPQTLRSRT